MRPSNLTYDRAIEEHPFSDPQLFHLIFSIMPIAQSIVLMDLSHINGQPKQKKFLRSSRKISN